MHDEKPFFMRDSWHYNPDDKPGPGPDANLGFDTRALHAGFRPLRDVEMFRSFVTPIVQSMTYPYETVSTSSRISSTGAAKHPP